MTTIVKCATEEATREYNKFLNDTINDIHSATQKIAHAYLDGSTKFNILCFRVAYYQSNIAKYSYENRITTCGEFISVDYKQFNRLRNYIINGISIGEIHHEKIIYELDRQVKQIDPNYYLVLRMNNNFCFGSTFTIDLHWDSKQKYKKYDMSNKFISKKRTLLSTLYGDDYMNVTKKMPTTI